MSKTIKETYHNNFILTLAEALTNLTKVKGQEDFARQNIENVECGYKTQFTLVKDDTADSLLAKTLSLYTNLTIGECKKVVTEARKAAGNINIKISYEPSTNIVDIYYAVARAVGFSEEEIEFPLHYDCREIDVAHDIQEGFFAASETAGMRNFEIGMIWCFGGPKTDEKLCDSNVRLSYGFFCKK